MNSVFALQFLSPDAAYDLASIRLKRVRLNRISAHHNPCPACNGEGDMCNACDETGIAANHAYWDKPERSLTL